MREQGLVAAQPRRKDPAPPSRPRARGSRPDLVKRDFTADRPGMKWVGGIHLYQNLGGTRSVWRPSPAAAPGKWSVMRLG